VAKLHVLQRTAPWVIPHRNRPMKRWERTIYRLFPPAQLAMRAGIYWARESFVLQFRHRAIGRLLERIPMAHMRKQIKDPELRKKLTPDYSIGCKRILPTNEWYPTLAQPNVEVVTGGLTEVRPRSVVAEDGSEREVDTIIFGTGFHVTDVPIADRVTGRHGRTLTETWNGSMQAYKGTTVAGFPNLFFLVGPNTGLGHSSIVFIIESQIAYVLDALRTMRRHGARTLEVREAAQAAYNAELDRMTEGTVWVSGGCTSYYIDRNGHNSALWPTYTWPFRKLTREFDVAAYALGAREREPLATAA
jgi:cation diffusion facilitator CzcD-associated flavoprotein CzcO